MVPGPARVRDVESLRTEVKMHSKLITRKTRMSLWKGGLQNGLRGGLLAGLALVLVSISFSGLAAQKYLPPGYGASSNIEGTGWGFDAGYQEIDGDYYITLEPTIEMPFPFWPKLRFGLQIPLEILAIDNEPKGTKKPPTIRKGTYDEIEDWTKIIKYVRYGTHLYFNPDDSFNWSFYYGKMTDGYIGHKTLIYRYVSTYDDTVHRAGFMADINNNWGGIEAFSSDVLRREVMAGRIYIRPVGLFIGMRDLFWANSGVVDRKHIALSIREQYNPDRNGGVFFQSKIPGGDRRKGSIGQQIHGKIGDENFNTGKTVKFKEVTDPVTGKTSVRAIPVDKQASNTAGGGSAGGTTGTTTGTTTTGTRTDPTTTGGGSGGTKSAGGTTTGGGSGGGSSGGGSDKPAEKWGPSFWNRFAIGYTIARDLTAPLTLEKDGSGNLVIDPDTGRPREDTSQVLTFVGVDAEMRLSPFRFLELTPYVDLNKIKDLQASEGLHVGVDMGIKLFGNFLKITFRPEYRELSQNYIPVYFDSYYTIERTAYLPDGDGSDSGEVGAGSVTKLEYLQSLSHEGGKTKGYFWELIVELFQVMVLEVTYENYDGADNSRIFAGIYVPNLFSTGLFANGYYTKKGFDKFGESFQFDDRSLAAGELGFSFFGSFYAKISYERTWEYNSTTSLYETRDEKTINFGFSSSL